MRIDVFTIFPEYLEAPLRVSVVGRARESGLLDVRLHDPREVTTDRHRSVDDEPFGGGAGMVMMPGRSSTRSRPRSRRDRCSSCRRAAAASTTRRRPDLARVTASR